MSWCHTFSVFENSATLDWSPRTILLHKLVKFSKWFEQLLHLVHHINLIIYWNILLLYMYFQWNEYDNKYESFRKLGQEEQQF